MLLNEQEDGGRKTRARKPKSKCLALMENNNYVSLVKCGLKYLDSLL